MSDPTQTTGPTKEDAADMPPLPPGMRDLLLQALALGYPAGAPQTRLAQAPDAFIAWQVQSMLNDYADYEARPDGAG